MDIKLMVLGLVGVGIKLLLIPAYFSTDFDVHHNWLRITFTKPLSEWYYDVNFHLKKDQSKWTLDYPPFFAYFEYLLAWFANLIDPQIMKLVVTNKILYFQRISVILTEIPFLYVLYIIFNRKVNSSLVFSYLFIPLIILDSKLFLIYEDIHFQYNIMLQTVFLVSVYFLVRKQNYLIAALTYSILLNFKHIYLYCSIAYFVLILKNYVLKQGNKNQNQNGQKMIRFAKVGLITILPFLISFGPFVMVGGVDGIKQIFSRLFPFRRGLIHDYWAPNFWALYFFADKILSFVLKIVFKYEPTIKITSISPAHKALNSLKVLPEPSANMTLLMIILCLMPLIAYAIKAKRVNSLRMIIVNGLVFFMFGYHVHEKAITPYLHLCYVFLVSNSQKNQEAHQQNEYSSIPQGQKSEVVSRSAQTISQKRSSQMDIIQVLCLIFFNIFSLFPLLIDLKEKTLKITIAILYYLIMKIKIQDSLKKDYNVQVEFYKYLLNSCLGLIVLCQIVVPFLNWVNGNKYEFLPLMINSVSCALVNFVWTFKMYYTELKSGKQIN